MTFITIDCSTNTYFVGGTVSGLLPGNYMVLQNNGSDDKIIMGNGPYVFDTPIEDETTYDVTIDLTPIDPVQPCQVSNANDNIMGNDVTDVDINCEVGDDLIFRNGFQLPPPPPEQD